MLFRIFISDSYLFKSIGLQGWAQQGLQLPWVFRGLPFGFCLHVRALLAETRSSLAMGSSARVEPENISLEDELVLLRAASKHRVSSNEARATVPGPVQFRSAKRSGVQVTTRGDARVARVGSRVACRASRVVCRRSVGGSPVLSLA